MVRGNKPYLLKANILICLPVGPYFSLWMGSRPAAPDWTSHGHLIQSEATHWLARNQLESLSLFSAVVPKLPQFMVKLVTQFFLAVAF